MKNKTFNLIVVIISACIFMYFFVFSRGLSTLIRELSKLNIFWIALSFAFIVAFWFFETVILHVITISLCKKCTSFMKSIRYNMIGQFFGAITPLASGSQAAQIYAMVEDGVSGGSAGSILMIKFIMHESINTLFLTLALLLRFNYFKVKIQYFAYLCILGYAINLSVILFAFIISVSEKTTSVILKMIVNLLKFIRVIKKPEEKYKKIESDLKKFHENAALIAKNKKMCSFALLITFIQWVFFYMIPYAIYRSFGFRQVDILTIMAAQIFLTMFMSFIPLPGAEGGAEGGFYLVFSMFFKSGTISTALFIWRIITYYASIAVGSIFTLMIKNKDTKHIST